MTFGSGPEGTETQRRLTAMLTGVVGKALVGGGWNRSGCTGIG